jgi:hypothetical protein
MRPVVPSQRCQKRPPVLLACLPHAGFPQPIPVQIGQSDLWYVIPKQHSGISLEDWIVAALSHLGEDELRIFLIG